MNLHTSPTTWCTSCKNAQRMGRERGASFSHPLRRRQLNPQGPPTCLQTGSNIDCGRSRWCSGCHNSFTPTSHRIIADVSSHEMTSHETESLHIPSWHSVEPVSRASFVFFFFSFFHDPSSPLHTLVMRWSCRRLPIISDSHPAFHGSSSTWDWY